MWSPCRHAHPRNSFVLCRFSISSRHQDGERGCQDCDTDKDIIDQDHDIDDGKDVVGGKDIVAHGNDVADDKDMNDDHHDDKDVVDDDNNIVDHGKSAVDHGVDDVDKEREETERHQRERWARFKKEKEQICTYPLSRLRVIPIIYEFKR